LVSINIIGLHFDDRYWNKPYEYNPDRWLDTQDKQPRNQFAYAPFSLGSRICIGNNFSILEQKLYLAQLLQKFEIELPEPDYVVPIQYKTVFTTKKNFQLKFKLRK